MDDRTPLQKKIADLGDRFLLRTLEDLVQMRVLAGQLADGDAAGSRAQMEKLAHRIHGSGATFGFDAISDVAGEIERLSTTSASGAELDAGLTSLEQHVRAAARAGGVEQERSC
jgi:HPt (histidine-containing phosphotransfer) domain-containing protein